MKLLHSMSVVLLAAGCATAGDKPPAITPHAEAGVGITVWKIPVAGFGLWFPPGYGAAGSQVVIHQYSYQAVPPTTQAGIPVEPPGPPTPVPYQTVYQAAPFDDPTLVIFQNGSDRVTFRIQVDDREPITLGPRQVSANLHLDMGDHQVKVSGTLPTFFGSKDIPERKVPLRIDSRGRSQIIHLAE